MQGSFVKERTGGTGGTGGTCRTGRTGGKGGTSEYTNQIEQEGHLIHVQLVLRVGIVGEVEEI